jgi:hypothetical protein
MVKKTAKVALEEDTLDKLSKEELEALAAQLESEDSSKVVAEDSADGTGGTEGNFKSNLMSVAMKKMADMSPDQMAIFMSSLDQIGHEADGVPGGASAHNQASIAMKGAIAEDLKLVFGGDKELSEEFKQKIEVLFESTVSARVAILQEEMKEKYAADLAEETTKIKTTLTEQADQYLSYVAEQWLADNEVAIQQSLRYEVTEDFIRGLKELFAEHYIDIPDEKLDLVDAMSTKVEELETSLNAQIEENMKLTNQIKAQGRDKLVSEMATGLTLSQTEKFKQLIETIDYDGDVENFKKKLEIVKESHFKADNKGKTSTNIIQEEVTYSSAAEDGETKKAPIDPEMRSYVNALSRTIKH